jgi:uncharacterized protein
MSSIHPTPIRRSELPPGEVLCSYCTARCCRYFSLPIETPKTWKDFDAIRWYMFHGRVNLFVDGGKWYLVIFADCQHLLPDNRCGTYETRPAICRKYSTKECEYDNDVLFQQLFETAEQLWEYAEAVLPPKKGTKRKRGELPTLTVIS